MKRRVTSRMTYTLGVILALMPILALGAMLSIYYERLRGDWAFLLAGILLYLLAGGVVVSIYQFLVVRRIRRLQRLLEKVREGDLKQRIDPPYLNDEIGVLEKGFNSLIASLDESQRALEDRMQELEAAHALEQEQEERFQLALKGADLGLWDENYQTGQAYYNERWASMLGYDLSEIEPVIASWENLLHPDDLPRVMMDVNAHVRGEKPFFESEMRMRAKSGEWRWILTRGKIVERDADGAPLRAVGTHLDITERKRADKLQQALYQLSQAVYHAKDLAALYQAMYDIISALLSAKYLHIALYQPEKDTLTFPFYVDTRPYPSGAVKLASAGLTGHLIKMGKPLLLANDDIQRLKQESGLELRKETAREWMGAPLRTATGKIVGAIVVQTYDDRTHFTQPDLELLDFVSTQVAMSLERKTAEDALRDSERRLELALKGADLGIWDYNLVTGRVVRNERWAEILGYRLEEVEPDEAFLKPRIHPDDRQRVNELIRLHHEGLTEMFEAEYRVLHKNGEWVWILDRGQAVERDETGQPVRKVGTHLDITERKRAELLQKALYRISEASATTQSLDDLYRFVQEVVNELMPAQNFYIALVDSARKLIHFPFVMDEVDDDASQTLPFDPEQRGGGLTAYLLRRGEPLLIDAAMDRKLREEGEVEAVGVPMLQWLGAPLKTADGRVIGALVVQSYREGVHYKESDKDLLAFVASQVAMAIERVQANQAIRESEERFRRLFEQSYESIILTDEEGSVVAWNQATERITGIPAAEVIGQKFWDVMYMFVLPEKRSPESYEQIKATHLNALKTGVSPMADQLMEVKMIRPDGRMVQLQQVAFTIRTNKGYILGTMSNDITERRMGEEKIQRQFQQMEALRTIDSAIASSFDSQVVLAVLLEQITSQLNVDAASILHFNPASQTLEFAASEGFRTDALRHTRLRLGEGFGGQAALQRQMIFIDNINEKPGNLVRAQNFGLEEFVSYLGLPLVAKGQLKGVLEIFHRSTLKPDREWLDFLEALAGQTAIAMDNASMFSQLQRTNRELSMAYDTTLEGWAHALELRDMETEGHSRRVTDMTVELAILMGFQSEELIHVRRGALLHDIGKMGIPDNILFKPGPLSDEEWKIMHRHPEYAYEMLHPIEFLRPALEIPYCHHEKWNGSGYPRKLKGEDIPLSARIFAVVDVWDSLIHQRPYKPAWTEARTMEYIREQSGVHFDPRVVKIFMRTIEKTRRASS